MRTFLDRMDELKPDVAYSDDEGEDANSVEAKNDSEYQLSDAPEAEDDELLDDDVVAEDEDNEQEQEGDDDEEEEEEDPKDGEEEYKPSQDELPEDEKDEDEEAGLGGGEDQENKAKADPSAESDGAPETGKSGVDEEQEPADAGEVAVGEEGKSTEEDAELGEEPAAELDDPTEPISIQAREDAETMLEAAEGRLADEDHLPSYVQAKLHPVFVNHLVGKGKVASYFPPDSHLAFQSGTVLVESAKKLLEDRDVTTVVDDISDFIIQTVDLYAKLGMELFRPVGAVAEGVPHGPTKTLQVLFGKSVLLPCVFCSTVLPFILLLLLVNLSHPFRGACHERSDHRRFR